MNRLKNENRFKITAVILSVAIIGILVLSGPASAFNMNLKSDKQSVKIGEKLGLTAEVDVDSAANEIQNFSIELTGPETVVCYFDLDGNLLSDAETCKGISVTRTDKEKGNGFGYGYGLEKNKKFRFLISLDTGNYSDGTYRLSFMAKTKNSEISVKGSQIDIIKVPDNNGKGKNK